MLQRVSAEGNLDVHLAFIEKQLTGERCNGYMSDTIAMPDDPEISMHAFALQRLDSAECHLPPLKMDPEEIIQVCLHPAYMQTWRAIIQHHVFVSC